MSFNIGGAVQGGMSGASAGSAAGPWGALAGGVLGGVAGGFFGGDDSGKLAKELLGRQMDRQEIWMKNQMQWRVQDAKLAGIHPLAAIGSNITAPSVPGVSVGDVGSDMGSMGQGIGRAVSAMMSDDEKYQTTLRALQIERGELENAQLRFNLQQMHSQAGSPPAFPNLAQGESAVPVGVVSDTRRYPDRRVWVEKLPGQGDGIVEMQPGKVTHAAPGNPGSDAGTNPDVRWYRDSAGNYFSNPSAEFKADDLGSPGTIQWFMRNRVVPALPYAGQNPHLTIPRPAQAPPRGAIGWYYNPFTGRHSPAYPGEGAEWHPWFIPDADRR